MKDNYSHITLVSDRSGSMQAVREDAEGAINAFIEGQKAVDGDCTIALVEFDAPSATDWLHQVYRGNIQHCPKYSLAPRGMTALLDAVGMTIASTGEYLDAMHDDEKPSKVIFVIETDGQENSSHEWTWEKVQRAIKHQTDEFNWQFVFLGMGSDSWAGGEQLGVQNIIRSSGAGAAHGSTYSVMTAYAADYRTGNADSMSRAANLTVQDDGKVYNQAGQEIDPKTGKVIITDLKS